MCYGGINRSATTHRTKLKFKLFLIKTFFPSNNLEYDDEKLVSISRTGRLLDILEAGKQDYEATFSYKESGVLADVKIKESITESEYESDLSAMFVYGNSRLLYSKVNDVAYSYSYDDYWDFNNNQQLFLDYTENMLKLYPLNFKANEIYARLRQ